MNHTTEKMHLMRGKMALGKMHILLKEYVDQFPVCVINSFLTSNCVLFC